jgi:hypothetical protein
MRAILIDWEKKRKGEKKKLPKVGKTKLRKKSRTNSRSQESFTFNH